MSGHHQFSELTKNFTPERRARIAGKKAAALAEMRLREIRQARALTQQALAEALHVKQPAIARMERRTDMYVSNLRTYIEAMGGTLRIVAEFPEGAVAIDNFSGAGKEQADSLE